VRSLKRAKAISSESQKSVGAVGDFITELEQRADEAADSGAPSPVSMTGLRELSKDMRNLVQIAAPRPVVAPSLDEVLKLAFEELIVDPVVRRQQLPRKSAAEAQLRKAYEQLGVHPLTKPTLRVGPEVTGFDFAVANGKAVQLVRCWSFQVADQDSLADEVKAWAWTVRSMRLARSTGETGSSLQTNEKILAVAAEVEVDALFIPPESGQVEKRAYEVALGAFRDSQTNIELIPVDRADDLARRGLALLSKAQAAQDRKR
jgi:hypothetical protein